LFHYKDTFKLLKLFFLLVLKAGLNLYFLFDKLFFEKLYHFGLVQKLRFNFLGSIFFHNYF